MRVSLREAAVTALLLPVIALANVIPQQEPLVGKAPSALAPSAAAIHPDAVKPLLKLHQQLVAIESITGNEHDVGAYLVRYLHNLGLSVEVQPVTAEGKSAALELVEPFTLLSNPLDAEDSYLDTLSKDKKKLPSRFNIFAYTNSSAKGHHHTLLTTHIDTVPPYIPYGNNATKHLKDNTLITGRGSVDAKASLAAMLTAWTSLLLPATSDSAMQDEQSSFEEFLSHFPPDVQDSILKDFRKPKQHTQITPQSTALLLVVGEETGGAGMRHASDYFASTKPATTFSVVINGEPTEFALACGHKGNLGFDIAVHGRAAHSGYPWLGVSANDVLVAALAALKFKAKWPSSEKYGNTTVNVGRLEGGVAANVVAERASAKVAVRIAGGEPGDVVKLVEDTVREATEELLKDGEGNVAGEVKVVFPSKGYGPIDCDCDIEGFETMTVNYGTDVPWLAGDHKRYLYGPGSILVAHSDHEAILKADLERGVEGYKKIILSTMDV